MDRVDLSGSDLDLDIDLESGGTSEEDARKDDVLSGEISKNLIGRMRCGFLRAEVPHGSTCNSDCSCSYEKLSKSDGISSKNREMHSGKFREEMINFVDKTMDKEKSKKQMQSGKFRGEMINFVDNTMDKEKSKKHNCAKPPKPPRPPRGPSLDASDVKLLKEISEINLKRKRMERIRTLKKMKKEKGSSLTSNLFALLVTVIFLLVIFMQGTNFAILKA